MSDKQDFTQILIEYGDGKKESLDEMLPAVYAELRRLAEKYLRNERADHTLQPTALVHEAYLRLVDQHSVDWRNRAQFIGMAAQMMRRILVNHAEAHKAAKRGDGTEKVSLDEAMIFFEEQNMDVLSLNEVLNYGYDFPRDGCKYFGNGLYGFDGAECLVGRQRIADARHIKIYNISERMLGIVRYADCGNTVRDQGPFVIFAVT